MRASGLYGLAVAATLVGCARPPTFPPPPGGVNRIVVEAPVNRTGDDLTVYGAGLVQRLLELKTETVPDILAEQLRKALTRQGFRVAEPGDDAPVLRTEILRWQPYAADYDTVTVDIVASLVEPGRGRELWKASETNWAVSTSDARSRSEASVAASEAIAEALLAGWEPAAAP